VTRNTARPKKLRRSWREAPKQNERGCAASNARSCFRVLAFFQEFNQPVLFAVDPHEPTIPEGGGASCASDAMETSLSTLLERFVEVWNLVAKVEQLYAVTKASRDRRSISKWLEKLDGEPMKFDEGQRHSLGLFHEWRARRADRVDGFHRQADVVEAGFASKYSALNRVQILCDAFPSQFHIVPPERIPMMELRRPRRSGLRISNCHRHEAFLPDGPLNHQWSTQDSRHSK
jgi:hypothetical protein